MKAEGEAEQRGHVAGAEDLGDQPAGQRHGAEPQDAHHRGEDRHAQVGHRQQNERGQGHRARDVQPGQQVFLAPAPAERPPDKAADDVEQADQTDRPRTHAGVDIELGEHHRKVRRYEQGLEPADAIARAQQQVAAMSEGLAQGIAHRLLPGGRCRFGPCGDQTKGQRDRQRDDPGQDHQRGDPIGGVQHRLGDGHQHDLPRKSAGTGDPGIDAALPFVGYHPADRGQDDRSHRAAHGDTRQHPDAEDRLEAGRRIGHHQKAQREGSSADRWGTRPGAPTVGDRARERGGDAPGQCLDRHREGQRLDPPAEITAGRCQPQPVGHPDPEGDHHHHRPA